MRAPRLPHAIALILIICSAVRSQSQITSVMPTNATPGDTVTISGSSFGNAPGALRVGSSTVTVDPVKWQSGSISFVLPPLPAGPAVVAVSAGGQNYSSSVMVLGSIRIRVSPAVIQPSNSKLPPSTTLGMVENDCDDNQGTDLTQGPNGPYSLAITGVGITLTSPTSTKCRIMATLIIDPSAAGPYTVFLLDKDKKPVSSADIGILDSTAGPIPPGLAPGVDVMWEVMGYKNCSDAFGRRVADSMYCIQIKIGNNAGHPLQLAGIGFSRDLKGLAALGIPSEVLIANNSYASTRAVLVHAQSISARNISYAFLQGAGLIMAASSPFIGKSGTAHHFQTFNTIINGPLLAAYNLIWPDPIIRQLNNLDDQAFRDNIVIANNAQVQTIVFVEKPALTQSLEELGLQLGAGKEIAEKKKQDQTTQNNQDQSTLNNIDSFYKQINDEINTTVKNSRRPIWKSPLWGPRSNPLLVKLALGKLVIVGDEIEYLQRVQVTSPVAPSTTSPLTANPSSLNFSSQNGVTNGSAQSITFTNTGSAPLTSVAVQISGTNASDFSQTNTCGSNIATGATCTVSVTYQPSATPAANPRNATLQVSFSPGSTPLSIPLTGGASNTVYLSAIQFSLGNATVTPSAPTTANLTITNFNGASVAVSIPASPPFTVSQCNGGTLNANTSCTVTITFTPAIAGPQATTLTASFQLTGGGVAPAAISVSGTGK